jgi:PAS domain S-box-containing protein
MTAPRILLVHPAEGGSRLRDAFETAGCRVQHVETATEAVATLSTESWDCLVSEFELSGDDGLTLRSAVRQLAPELPFVLFTDSDAIEESVAVVSECDSYVRKNGEQSVDRLVSEVTERGTEAASTAPQRDVSDAEPSPDELVRTMDAAPIGISLSDPSMADYPLVYVNDAWEELTGYEAADLLGRNPRLLQGPNTDPETVDRLSESIADEEPVSVEIRNYRRDGTPFWNELTLAPIYDDEGDLLYYVGFQIDVTDRREAERLAEQRAEELDAERRTLRRVLDRINGLLREVSGVLVESTERSEIEHRVCETIATEAGYMGGWIGTVSSDGTAIQLSATAGLPVEIQEPIPIAELPAAVGAAVDTDGLQQCSVDDAGDGQQCSVDDTGDETVVRSENRLAPATVGGRRLLVVPLCDGERRYGLLGVYGTDATALDTREQEVFGSLGKMIANGLHAVETTRILTTDHVTELRIEIRDPSFWLSQIASLVGGPVERCGTTNTSSGDYELYLTTDDAEAVAADAGDVDSLELTSLACIEAARVVSSTERELTVSVTMPQLPPDDALAEFGAVITGTTATADAGTLTVEAPPQQEVRPLLEALQSRYDTVDLRARTRREQREQRPAEFTAVVDERLTERQADALEAAHLNDYFEWPRPVDGETISETMDITRQTFHQHLRAAERKLIAAYVDA